MYKNPLQIKFKKMYHRLERETFINTWLGIFYITFKFFLQLTNIYKLTVFNLK